MTVRQQAALTTTLPFPRQVTPLIRSADKLFKAVRVQVIHRAAARGTSQPNYLEKEQSCLQIMVHTCTLRLRDSGCTQRGQLDLVAVKRG
jgi:hypothetical protein